MDSSPVCLDDFEEHAVRVLAQGPLGYFQTGADDEITLRENRRAFTRWKILPRVLRDVSSCDLSTTILGHRISFPVCVAPTGYQGDAHPDGEIATAQAAFEMNTCYTMSTMSSKSIEDVSSAAPAGLRFFQLYIFKQRDITKQLIRRAEKAGFNALVVTVDVPFLAKRRKDIRNKYTPSPQARTANFTHGLHDGPEGLHSHVAELIDPSLTWDDLTFFKSFTKMPVILKGILTAEDAKLAVQAGVAGIMVSNHGGRQLDTVPATIDVLAEVVAAVESKCEVYMDGGVRLGTDVFKALALGAKAVFIGRPVVYGLVYNGREGVKKVLQILREELESSMALSGCANIAEIKSNLVRHLFMGKL